MKLTVAFTCSKVPFISKNKAYKNCKNMKPDSQIWSVTVKNDPKKIHFYVIGKIFSQILFHVCHFSFSSKLKDFKEMKKQNPFVKD